MLASAATELAAIIVGALALLGTGVTAVFQYRGVRAAASAQAANSDPSSLEGWRSLVNELQEEASAAREEARVTREEARVTREELNATRLRLQRLVNHLIELGIPLPPEDIWQ